MHDSHDETPTDPPSLVDAERPPPATIAPSDLRAARLGRIAVAASIATDAFLLAAVGAWQWGERQPIDSAPWRLPILLALTTLGCGAVALIAARRTNRVLLFLSDFIAVLVAAWLFNHLYERLAIGGAREFWLR
jgi:hypothetical protein